jgi:CheY-like chemotaxis protein/signal transduction histidine kinase
MNGSAGLQRRIARLRDLGTPCRSAATRRFLKGLELVAACRAGDVEHISVVLPELIDELDDADACVWRTFVQVTSRLSTAVPMPGIAAVVPRGRQSTPTLRLVCHGLDIVQAPHDERERLQEQLARAAVAEEAWELATIVLCKLVDDAVAAADYRRAFERQERLTQVLDARLAVSAARPALAGAHDILTPLHGVINSADLLSERAQETGDEELVALVHASAKRLHAALVGALGCSEGGGCRSVAVGDLVARGVAAARESCRARGVCLHQDDTAATAAVYTEPIRLQQVFSTLLEVGVGVCDAELGVRVHPFESHVRFEFWVDRRTDGLGVGLADTPAVEVAQRIAARLDAQLTVSAGGSYAWLRVPCKPLCAGGDPTGHVLVAEDDPMAAVIMKAMLERIGWRYTLVRNGREAVRAAAREQFDVVLMDCDMPVMDGWEATRRLREMGFSGGIYACTASQDEARCRAVGMDDVLFKPATVDQVRQVLQRTFIPG